MEIAVIGNSEFILGFRLAGIRKTYAAENDEKLNEYITSVLAGWECRYSRPQQQRYGKDSPQASRHPGKFREADRHRYRWRGRGIVHERENQEIGGC